MHKGRVYLVGAGPGAPGLITVRGAELLASADCVIYDSLANPALLEHVRPGTELINVGKRSGSHSFTQQQINELLIQKAFQHKVIVRLKGGDPCIFGRAAEEARALADASVEFEIVPGVTSAIAAAEYAGIMLTDRDSSSQVLFATGRESEGKESSGIDWEILARFCGSIVFYMGVGSLDGIVQRLLERGAPQIMPVCIIENATLPHQRVLRGVLSDISVKAAEVGIAAPAIIIVGKAAANDPEFDWFARLPLRGRRIVLTRDAGSNKDSANKVVALGGIPIPFENLRFRRLTESKEFLSALSVLSSYDWLVFTSERGVDAFWDSISSLGKDARVLGHARIACVGNETAASLKRFGVHADFIPSIHTGIELAKQLIAGYDINRKKILLLRSAIAEPAVPDLLKAAGASVDDVACYTTESAGADPTDIITMLRDNKIDWVTFTSGSAARAFIGAVGMDVLTDSSVKIASIGPVTSRGIKECGLAVAAEAQEHNMEGILRAIIDAERSSRER